MQPKNNKNFAAGGNTAISKVKQMVEQTISQNPVVFKRLAEI